jgi:prepilin-type N-terminal cleavage/methylation domain-containing protein
MKKILSKTAYTLIELIVSLVLVSVIALGIFSVNMVLNNNNQDYGQRYLVRSETQMTLNHILNNASLAIGDGTSVGTPSELNYGILILSANSFAIHQGGTANGYSNIINSATDIWLVYSLSSYNINYCTKAYNLSDSTGYRGANGSCSTASQFLGTAYSISHPSAPLFNSTTGFSITIQNCLNDSLATCSSTGTSTDLANNPEVQLTGSVFPPQQSF